jgi:hypothetical protein
MGRPSCHVDDAVIHSSALANGPSGLLACDGVLNFRFRSRLNTKAVDGLPIQGGAMLWRSTDVPGSLACFRR